MASPRPKYDSKGKLIGYTYPGPNTPYGSSTIGGGPLPPGSSRPPVLPPRPPTQPVRPSVSPPQPNVKGFPDRPLAPGATPRPVMGQMTPQQASAYAPRFADKASYDRYMQQAASGNVNPKSPLAPGSKPPSVSLPSRPTPFGYQNQPSTPRPPIPTPPPPNRGSVGKPNLDPNSPDYGITADPVRPRPPFKPTQPNVMGFPDRPTSIPGRPVTPRPTRPSQRPPSQQINPNVMGALGQGGSSINTTTQSDIMGRPRPNSGGFNPANMQQVLQSLAAQNNPQAAAKPAFKKGGKVSAKAPVKKAAGGKVAAKAPVKKAMGGKVAAKPMSRPVAKAKPMARPMSAMRRGGKVTMKGKYK